MTVQLEHATDEHLEFLDALRASGQVNMFGAGPFVQEEFDMNKRDARDVLMEWMETFSERHPDE